MPVPPTNTQSVIAVLIAAYLCVTHWRTILRVLLMVVIALAVYGAVAGIDGMTALMAQHHHG
jgi:hypothetical protein